MIESGLAWVAPLGRGAVAKSPGLLACACS